MSDSMIEFCIECTEAVASRTAVRNVPLMGAVKSARAELAELRKDRARLDKLERICHQTATILPGKDRVEWSFKLEGEPFRAAIDAAMETIP